MEVVSSFNSHSLTSYFFSPTKLVSARFPTPAQVLLHCPVSALPGLCSVLHKPILAFYSRSLNIHSWLCIGPSSCCCPSWEHFSDQSQHLKAVLYWHLYISLYNAGFMTSHEFLSETLEGKKHTRYCPWICRSKDLDKDEMPGEHVECEHRNNTFLLSYYAFMLFC